MIGYRDQMRKARPGGLQPARHRRWAGVWNPHRKTRRGRPLCAWP